MSVIAIVQARTGSTRFPNKVLQPICGIPLIEFLYNRLKCSASIDKVVIATTNSLKDDELAKFLSTRSIPCFRGDEFDVLSRYHDAALMHNAKHIVRVTGDCPFVDPNVVDLVVSDYFSHNVDYCSNTLNPTYPDGLDVSVFSFDALQYTHQNATTSYDREFVVTYLRTCDKHSVYSHQSPDNYSHLRLTVDEPVDYDVIRSIADYFKPRTDFSFKDILNLFKVSPEIFSPNMSISRDEGSKFGQGYRLWKRSQQLIPGGNMLFSKRPELYLPKLWPTYYSKTSGTYVWDLEDNKYLDMFFAVGTNTLGYCCPQVDEAVVRCIHDGNMSTFNCPEEVQLAERLISLHPWAHMAKFARSGGEANSIAIRIARAFSGKSSVAFCGYHGWHDWYLSSYHNSSDLLSKHLTSGLKISGVPSELANTSLPFRFNDIESLKSILENNDIGVVKVEVYRNFEPSVEYLQSIRDLCDFYNCVLVFDECTSGFRQSFGGIHKNYGVTPDLCIFGKALGNGYAITAVIGTESVMQAANNSFISSTYWTEKIGYVAALSTLDVMEMCNSWEILNNVGLKIISIWKSLASKYNLEINIFGFPAIPKFTLLLDSWPGYKTLISQTFFNHNIIASNLIYVSIVHDSPSSLEKYQCALDEAFKLVCLCESGDLDLDNLLETSIATADFSRLN